MVDGLFEIFSVLGRDRFGEDILFLLLITTRGLFEHIDLFVNGTHILTYHRTLSLLLGANLVTLLIEAYVLLRRSSDDLYLRVIVRQLALTAL